MSIQFSPSNQLVLVTMESSVFEAAGAHQLVSALSDYEEKPVKGIALDFTGIEQADSVAFQSLLQLQSRFHRRGGPSLALCNPTPAVRQLIQLLGLDRVFEIAGSPSTVAA